MLKIGLFLSLFCFLSFSSLSQTEDSKVFVQNWFQAHPEVRVVSQATYNTYNDAKKAEFNALPHKFICQTLPTKAEILAYENSITTPKGEQVIDKQ